jgi:glutathione S-transferase
MRELQIFGAPGSNYVWAVRLACTEKKVPYTLIPTMPHTPEVDAIHPLGKIPAMRHGDIALCESRAICSYIDRAFAGPPLVPEDPLSAARVEQWISIINTHCDPVLVRRYLGAYFFPRTADGGIDRQTIEAALAEMRTCIEVLDAAVAATGHLAGATFTLADINLLPILFYLNKMPESRALLARSKHLQAYFDRHFQRPSVQATCPQSLPGNAAQIIAAVEAA